MVRWPEFDCPSPLRPRRRRRGRRPPSSRSWLDDSPRSPWSWLRSPRSSSWEGRRSPSAAGEFRMAGRVGSVAGADSGRSEAGATNRGLEAIVRRRREPSSPAGAGGSAPDERPELRASSPRPAPKSSRSEACSNWNDCSLSLAEPSPEAELGRRVGRFEELERSVGMRNSKKTHSAIRSQRQPHCCHINDRTPWAIELQRVEQH